MNNIGPRSKEALQFIAKTTSDPSYIIVLLSQKFRTTPETTHRLLARLQNRNLIQLAPPKIGNGKRLQLTPKGQSVLAGNWHL